MKHETDLSSNPATYLHRNKWNNVFERVKNFIFTVSILFIKFRNVKGRRFTHFQLGIIIDFTFTCSTFLFSDCAFSFIILIYIPNSELHIFILLDK